MVYKPSIFSDVKSVEELGRLLQEEFRHVEKGLAETIALDLRPTGQEPVRPREGMIVYADGAGWNPGLGEGPYIYKNGAWTALRTGVDPTPTAGPGYINVKDFGALGDQVTDDTAAIQAAIDSITEFSAGAIYFPTGFYKIIGSGTEALLIDNRQVEFFGDGQAASVLFFDSTVPNTRDMISITSDSTVQGYHFHDLGLLSSGKGRHILNFHWTEASGTFAYQIEIENLFISESEAGASIRLQGVAYSSISRCNLASILIVEGGDGVTIRENVIGATIGHCIDGDFVAGAGGFVVFDNVLAGTQGHVVLRRATHPTIAFNELETPVSQTNTYGFLMDIGVTSGVLSPTFVGNGYSILPGTSDPVAIRIRGGCLGAQIAETRIMNQGTSNHIQIDTGAEDTKIDRNGFYAAGASVVEVQVGDSGTRTGYKQYLADGTSGSPSLAFLSERTLGFYRASTGIMGLSGDLAVGGDVFLLAGSQIDWNGGGITIAEGTDALFFTGASGLYQFSHAIIPQINDGAALGAGAVSWSDLFLAAGGVINWNNGDVTITHSTNLLSFAGAANGYSFDSQISAASLLMPSGAIIDWASGDVTITHSTNLLSFTGAALGYSFDSAISAASLLMGSGAIIDWASGDVTITHSTNRLDYTGATNGYHFDASLFATTIELSSGQIVFPASQNPSANANTLDDYEEGTFVPQLTFGGGSSGMSGSTFDGSYTKIGNRVFGEISIILTAKGSSTGTAAISGLPFTIGATTVGTLQVNSMAAGLTVPPTAGMASGGTVINPSKISAGAQVLLTEADFTDTSIIRCGFQYRV